MGSATEESVAFGANEWLVDELWTLYQQDPNLVEKTWWPLFESRAAGSAATPPADAAPSATPVPPTLLGDDPSPVTAPIAKTTSIKPKEAPIPAEAPTSPTAIITLDDEPVEEAGDVVNPLRGMAKALASNMDASLQVPTATSVRTVPAKLMIDNRIVINNHLRRARGGKVSFTHLIAWAMIKAIRALPNQNVYYDEIDGKPVAVHPANLNLGIAIDMPKPDGTRGLVVPGIKRTQNMGFSDFLVAYEDVVTRAREGALTAEDYAGNTVSLTNPGGIGTEHSVPRLMKGGACIIGAGALEYPAEFQGSAKRTLADLGIGKTITLTSTYDHRVIQGAGSGEFLKKVHELLIGGEGFFEEIFASLRIPYMPIHWAEDIAVNNADTVNKISRVQELINAFRVRGHLMADIDPLEYRQRSHPDLEIESHGLTFWDLDREFVTGGFGGRRTMLLREILGVLRDSYCRTIGIEYMHIQEPDIRAWFQDKLEKSYEKPDHAAQLRILSKLNQAEAFETFLQTKYVGQKRFSLEGAESTVSLVDEILQAATEDGLDEVAIAMAHRGRLNVLANIAGKTYGQIFREFEGTADIKSVQGSGDVKYHLGTEGTYTSPSGVQIIKSVQGSGDVKYHLGTEGTYTSPTGVQIPVYLAANPSHLEAVNGVLEGIVRAKQDRKEIGRFGVLPVILHGDAAMAGQGVVLETLQMSQLRAYQTGGTMHIIVNNQVGFTTLPHDGRTSIYASDVAKTIQAPIFHVNGDDPEAVLRVAEVAFAYRQKFKADVVIDLICYRRRGHNEGDDPSMTQPLMYNLVEAKRSVRTLYTEALMGRGDITADEFEAAQRDFQGRLESAFQETHAVHTGSITVVSDDAGAISDVERPISQRGDDSVGEPETTGVDSSVLSLIGEAHANYPPGFTVHPKLEALLEKRREMARSGEIDWSFGELLALGSLLVEGTPVRLVGQDARRGTFVQRHAVLHDRINGQEWLPLMNMAESQARLWIYDSLLSEYAALAFEYGYSVERPDALVMWEAQFGDFVNGAQTIIDEFISSAEQKWGQRSSVVMLLPHGFEGQGPDHSSARIERFLQLAAEDNMIIARPSTPASYFHLLRRQAYARPRKPLVVFTPKAMLRLRGATSGVSDFTSGRFEAVLDDPAITDVSGVTKVLFVAGKIYYDLRAEIEKRGLKSIAIVRIEQFYPFPGESLKAIADRYPGAQHVWVQDEPENQGAWPFMMVETQGAGLPALSVVSRARSASPATGSSKRSQSEAQLIVDRALA
ncbi:MAG: alpha-ketoglutarate decarboxylase [Microbacteriaceae bacterium BACL25 MAG-120322-bin65]|nr:MAG: alpha-ketoglutarate decarboxylase [Microbacteriaceae bacterium BACL25 MAG-120322-bin65]